MLRFPESSLSDADYYASGLKGIPLRSRFVLNFFYLMVYLSFPQEGQRLSFLMSLGVQLFSLLTGREPVLQLSPFRWRFFSLLFPGADCDPPERGRALS